MERRQRGELRSQCGSEQTTLGLSRASAAVMCVLVLASAPVIANLQAGQLAACCSCRLRSPGARRTGDEKSQPAPGWPSAPASNRSCWSFSPIRGMTHQRTAARSFVVTLVGLSCVSLAVAGPAAHVGLGAPVNGCAVGRALLERLTARAREPLSFRPASGNMSRPCGSESLVVPLWVGLAAFAARGDNARAARCDARRPCMAGDDCRSDSGVPARVGRRTCRRAAGHSLEWLRSAAALVFIPDVADARCDPGPVRPPAVALRLVQTDLGIATATLGSVYRWALIGIWGGTVFPRRRRGP